MSVAHNFFDAHNVENLREVAELRPGEASKLRQAMASVLMSGLVEPAEFYLLRLLALGTYYPINIAQLVEKPRLTAAQNKPYAPNQGHVLLEALTRNRVSISDSADHKFRLWLAPPKMAAQLKGLRAKSDGSWRFFGTPVSAELVAQLKLMDAYWAGRHTAAQSDPDLRAALRDRVFEMLVVMHTGVSAPLWLEMQRRASSAHADSSTAARVNIRVDPANQSAPQRGAPSPFLTMSPFHASTQRLREAFAYIERKHLPYIIYQILQTPGIDSRIADLFDDLSALDHAYSAFMAAPGQQNLDAILDHYLARAGVQRDAATSLRFVPSAPLGPALQAAITAQARLIQRDSKHLSEFLYHNWHTFQVFHHGVLGHLLGTEARRLAERVYSSNFVLATSDDSGAVHKVLAAYAVGVTGVHGAEELPALVDAALIEWKDEPARDSLARIHAITAPRLSGGGGGKKRRPPPPSDAPSQSANSPATASPPAKIARAAAVAPTLFANLELYGAPFFLMPGVVLVSLLPPEEQTHDALLRLDAFSTAPALLRMFATNDAAFAESLAAARAPDDPTVVSALLAELQLLQPAAAAVISAYALPLQHSPTIAGIASALRDNRAALLDLASAYVPLLRLALLHIGEYYLRFPQLAGLYDAPPPPATAVTIPPTSASTPVTLSQAAAPAPLLAASPQAVTPQSPLAPSNPTGRAALALVIPPRRTPEPTPQRPPDLEDIDLIWYEDVLGIDLSNELLTGTD